MVTADNDPWTFWLQASWPPARFRPQSKGIDSIKLLNMDIEANEFIGRWHSSIVKFDLETCDQLRAAEYAFVLPSGEVLAKADELEMLAELSLRPKSMDVRNIVVSYRGDTKIISYSTSVKTAEEFEGSYDVTLVLTNKTGDWKAVSCHSVITPDGLPLPPPELHSLVGANDLTPYEFLFVGEGCARSVRQALRNRNSDIDAFEAILDFGCGCGRVIRFFKSLKNAKLYGTDNNPVLIDWCKNNLPFADFGVNQLEPPLNYHDGEFDLVYAFSVFTHLPEELQFRWIEELSRVLKPGGYLFFTTMGEMHAGKLLTGEKKEAFDSGHFVVTDAEVAGENLCLAYSPEKYVREKLTKGFEVLSFVKGDVYKHGDHEYYKQR